MGTPVKYIKYFLKKFMREKNGHLFEELIKGISVNAIGTSGSAERPFPMTDSLVLWYDLFIKKTHRAFEKIDIKNIDDLDMLKNILPTVSNLRFILFKTIFSSVFLQDDRREKSKRSYQYVFNFILEVIHKLVPLDSYCVKTNLYFTQNEVEERIGELKIKSVEDISESKLIAKFNLGLTSLVHGIYNDIVTDFGIDVYGPYKVVIGGERYTLLIKHFPFLNPKDLRWPSEFLPSVKEIYLYNFYQGVKWEIKSVGCHTNIISGNSVDGLKKYAAIADGKILSKDKIEVLTENFLKKARNLYLYIMESGFEEQKIQALYQECFQFKKIFDKAGLDWRPNEELLNRMKGEKINASEGSVKNIEDYRRVFKIDKFKEEMQNKIMFTKRFKEISKDDTGIAGGKGASLGEMTKAGIPVPEGFVILSDAFEWFIEYTDLDVEINSTLHKVDHNAMRTVKEASEKIQSLILSLKMPQGIADEVQKEFKKLNTKYVAVRSSATAEDSTSAAWAGQLDTYLNTTKENLLENVQKCWASLFTPRAIFYRFEQNLHKQKISVAVVIQKMVESEKSGIAFSVHPVTQDKNQLIIEAGYGLGEAVVSGLITPDSYVVEKEQRRIIDKNINIQEKELTGSKNGGNEWRNILKGKGKKSVLDDKQILELSELILKIEKHYKSPQDIEWVFYRGKFLITQSRPITTLTNRKS